MVCFLQQYLLSGWSYQFLEHCPHQDVVILPLWLKNVCLSLVEEVSRLGMSFVAASFCATFQDGFFFFLVLFIVIYLLRDLHSVHW